MRVITTIARTGSCVDVGTVVWAPRVPVGRRTRLRDCGRENTTRHSSDATWKTSLPGSDGRFGNGKKICVNRSKNEGSKKKAAEIHAGRNDRRPQLCKQRMFKEVSGRRDWRGSLSLSLQYTFKGGEVMHSERWFETTERSVHERNNEREREKNSKVCLPTVHALARRLVIVSLVVWSMQHAQAPSVQRHATRIRRPR